MGLRLPHPRTGAHAAAWPGPSGRDAAQADYARRLHALHGLGSGAAAARSAASTEHPDSGAANLAEAELRAQFGAFLGDDYSPAVLWQVQQIQRSMLAEQDDLAHRLQTGLSTPEAFASASNAAMNRAFQAMQAVLGRADFERLFGMPAPTVGGLADAQAFAAAQGQRAATPKPR